MKKWSGMEPIISESIEFQKNLEDKSFRPHIISRQDLIIDDWYVRKVSVGLGGETEVSSRYLLHTVEIGSEEETRCLCQKTDKLQVREYKVFYEVRCIPTFTGYVVPGGGEELHTGVRGKLTYSVLVSSSVHEKDRFLRRSKQSKQRKYRDLRWTKRFRNNHYGSRLQSGEGLVFIENLRRKKRVVSSTRQ